MTRASLNLRFRTRPGLHKMLQEAADKHDCSLNSEIEDRLHQSFILETIALGDREREVVALLSRLRS